MKTMIPPQVGMRLRTLQKKEKGQKKRRPKKNKKKGEKPKKEKAKKTITAKQKMREKERRGNATILLPHLCFKVAPCSSYRESLMLSLSYTSGNFSL